MEVTDRWIEPKKLPVIGDGVVPTRLHRTFRVTPQCGPNHELGINSVFKAGSAASNAETRWERNHPRRDQVNDRLENQNQRINQEYREGRNYTGTSDPTSSRGSRDPTGRTHYVKV
jgi:hypothetical protein